MTYSTPTIGILAVQGGVSEHVRSLEAIGCSYRLVRRNNHLEGLDGLIFPGGESTTMSKLLVASAMDSTIGGLLAEGLPAYGTCAGMILLAKEVINTRADAISFGAIEMTVRRNAFGRQTESFEAAVDVAGISRPVEAVFIRAPWVDRVGDGVEVLATVTHPGAPIDRLREDPHNEHRQQHEAIVAVRQGVVMATSFHPEVTDDTAIHELFITSCVQPRRS